MAIANSTDIEKENLEAHVELCAERYRQLETKLDGLEKRMDKLEEHVVFIRGHLAETGNLQNKQLITIGTTIIGILMTSVIGLIVHLIMK
jgi:tetrahydromethanopterin S-methyltransferase subunit G